MIIINTLITAFVFISSYLLGGIFLYADIASLSIQLGRGVKHTTRTVLVKA